MYLYLNSVKYLWFLCSAVYWYLGSYLISYLFDEAIYTAQIAIIKGLIQIKYEKD